MKLTEILADFEKQKDVVKSNIQTLNQQLAEQQQLFLKLEGAVDATNLIIQNVSDYVVDSDVVDYGEVIDTEVVDSGVVLEEQPIILPDIAQSKGRSRRS